MRRFLLLLMIVLLPLRAGIGDAMAAGMAAQQATAIQKIAANVHSTLTTGSSDTQMAATMPCHQDAKAPVSPTGKLCKNCAACEACHAVAIATALPIVDRSHPLPVAPPQGPALRYASADAAPHFRPPISA